MKKVVREYEGNVEVLDYNTFVEDLKFQIRECSLLSEDYLLYKEEKMIKKECCATEEEFYDSIFKDHIKSLEDGYSIEIMGDCYYFKEDDAKKDEDEDEDCTSNLKKALIKELDKTVELRIEKKLIEECFDKFLKKEFGLENIKYKFKRCSFESDLIDIEFEDYDIACKINEKYSLDSNLLELVVGQELGAKESDRICVYCPDMHSTEYIGIMLSPKLLIDDLQR